MPSITRSLSSIYSDVSNIITLVEEVRKQHIVVLHVFLPYALDVDELEKIRHKTSSIITQFRGDQDFLQVSF